jgi:hypothetical protein
MRKFAVVVLLILCVSSLAMAQAGRGYAYFAPGQVRYPGGSDTMLGFGGGGKYISESGAGLGAELGIVGPKGNFKDDYAGIFSLNGYYVFKTKDKKAEPFVTGGYTRAWRQDVPGNWFNFGGGLDYWFHPKAGLMLEFRDHINRSEFDGSERSTIQLWAIRIGVTFR